MAWQKDQGRYAKQVADDALKQVERVEGILDEAQQSVASVEGAVRKATEDTAAIVESTRKVKDDTEAVRKETAAIKAATEAAATRADERGRYAETQGNRAKAEADRLEGTDVSSLDNKIKNVTTQLADKATYDGSIIDLLHSHCALKNNVIVKVRENKFIDVGVYYSENKITQYTLKQDGDGWYRLRDAVLKDLSGKPTERTIVDEIISPAEKHKNFESTTGNWITSSPISNATTPGATFTLTFEGTGFFFSSFRDDRGGIWEFSVDGNVVKTISVWSETASSNVREEIVKGLSDGIHTIVATFKGDDPNHIPRDGAGTSRGWANNNTGTGTSHKTIAPIIAVYAEGNNLINLPVKQEDSRQEFAYQVSPSESQTNYVWVPEHGVLGVMKDISYKIYFGDREVTDLAQESSSFQEYSSVKIITNYNAYFPGDDNPLWKGRIDQTINGRGFHVSGKMEFLRNTYIRIGYSGMWASSKTHTDNDRVVTSKSKRYSLPKNINDGSNITLSEIPSGVAHFTQSSTNKHALNAVSAVELYDYNRGLRLGQTGSHPNPVRVDLRTDGQRKTYMASHRQATVPAGEVFTFTTRYFSCEIENASEILP